jgi:hypothetical protein
MSTCVLSQTGRDAVVPSATTGIEAQHAVTCYRRSTDVVIEALVFGQYLTVERGDPEGPSYLAVLQVAEVARPLDSLGRPVEVGTLVILAQLHQQTEKLPKDKVYRSCAVPRSRVDERRRHRSTPVGLPPMCQEEDDINQEHACLVVECMQDKQKCKRNVSPSGGLEPPTS